MNTIPKQIMYAYGWIFVRPRRYFFRKMIGNNRPRWWLEKDYWGIRYPNIHWWLLYKTVFKFFTWLYHDAWRYFCNWTGGFRTSFPWRARMIYAIGRTTAGFAISGGECYHCGFEAGCQVELAQDETGNTFILEGSGQTATMDGTNYWFEGTTICPICGFRAHYHDSSL